MGKLIQLIGSGVGLASEALHNRKVAKADAEQQRQTSNGVSSSASTPRQISYDDPPPEYVEVSEESGRAVEDRAVAANKGHPDEKKNHNPYESTYPTYPDEKAGHNVYDKEEGDEDTSSEEGDEEAWELDEASRELAGSPSEEQGLPADVKSLADTFIRNHPPPPHSGSRLSCPVILPQRRPRDKKRGFVRAYAPVLRECGIDQATFLEFLKNFHTSCQADKWLSVVNLAANVVGLVPGPITMGVSIGVQVAAGIAMEVQRLSR